MEAQPSLYSLAGAPLHVYYKEAIKIWPVFGPGHKPLRTQVSRDTLINFSAQRAIRQSSLTLPVRLIDSSMREGSQGKSQQSKEKRLKGEKRQTKHTLGDRIKLVQTDATGANMTIMSR